MLDRVALKAALRARQRLPPSAGLRSLAKLPKHAGARKERRKLNKPFFAASQKNIRLKRCINKLILKSILLPGFTQHRAAVWITKGGQMARETGDLNTAL